MNICIECIWDSDFQKVADITVPVIEAYAGRHKYGMAISNLPYPPFSRNIQWHRVTLLEGLLAVEWGSPLNLDCVCHIDADVLITNPEIRLEDLMPEGDWDIAMSRETGGALNDGTCLFRNTAATRAFLQLAWDSEAPDATSMNGVIQKMFDDGTLSQHIKLAEIPKRKFNSYWDDWRPGDFALHLPGMSNERRVMIFTKVQKELPAMEMRELLRPWKLNEKDELMRFGHNQDGGYLVSRMARNKAALLFSYGIGNEFSFEVDFAASGQMVFGFDPGMDAERTHQFNFITFVKQPLTDQAECIGWHRRMLDGEFPSVYMLKMDVEGAEYDALSFGERGTLSEATQIIVEFHWIFNNTEKLKAVLKRLDEIGFKIVHVHGNNHGGYRYGLPETVEVTFVNTAFVAVGDRFIGVLPIPGVDFPNDPNKPDYAIHFE